MEKTYELKPSEMQQMTALEQDSLRLSARWGMLRREMDNLDKGIAASEEWQRTFIRATLKDRGVEQFLNARIEPGKIVCTMEDSMAARPNGGVEPEVQYEKHGSFAATEKDVREKTPKEEKHPIK